MLMLQTTQTGEWSETRTFVTKDPTVVTDFDKTDLEFRHTLILFSNSITFEFNYPSEGDHS